jgi:hypothetical protein
MDFALSMGMVFLLIWLMLPTTINLLLIRFSRRPNAGMHFALSMAMAFVLIWSLLPNITNLLLRVV